VIRVPVTLRSADTGAPTLDTEGVAPSDVCPLCVTRVAIFDYRVKKWVERDAWQITHRPTGFNLGKREWPTEAEAFAVLEKCDPTFPAWQIATGETGCAATVACKIKFKWATQ
jgi:hypothetical protein